MAGISEYEILLKVDWLIFIQKIYWDKPIVRIKKLEDYEPAIVELLSLISKWDRRYENPEIDCGGGWDITVNKESDGFWISGYAAFPDDFDEMMEVLVHRFNFEKE